MKGGKMLRFNITDEETLFRCYMPFLKNGGLFYPTDKSYKIGDEVVLLLALFNEEKTSIAGKVAWLNPKNGGRPAGIGVHFNKDDQGKANDVRNKIENLLANKLKSPKRTHTM